MGDEETTMPDNMPAWAIIWASAFEKRVMERLEHIEKRTNEMIQAVEYKVLDQLSEQFTQLKAHMSAESQATQENSAHLAKAIKDAVDGVIETNTLAGQLQAQLEDVQHDVQRIKRKVAPNGDGS